MQENETTKMLLGRVAKAIWPQDPGDGTSTHPDDVFMKLLEMSGSARECRRPENEVTGLERAARFVRIASERGEDAGGRYAANQAWRITRAILNPPMTWLEALEELRRGNAVRRARWGMYVDVEFGSDASWPYMGHDGTPFRLFLIEPNGTEGEYNPLTEDAHARDWQRA